MYRVLIRRAHTALSKALPNTSFCQLCTSCVVHQENNPAVNYYDLEVKCYKALDKLRPDYKPRIKGLDEKYLNMILFSTVLDSLRPRMSQNNKEKLRAKIMRALDVARTKTPAIAETVLIDGKEYIRFTNKRRLPEGTVLGDKRYPYRQLVDLEVQTAARYEGKEDFLPERTDRSVVDEDDNVFVPEDVDTGVPRSDVPCRGCGALLQCNDVSKPGYIPAKDFVNMRKSELRSVTCHRCLYLNKHNAAINVDLPIDEYEAVLVKALRARPKAMVLLVVDLLDFPCSILPNLSKIIKNRTVYLVGNKVDLLPQDTNEYLEHVRKQLETTAKEFTDVNIKHTCLVSGTTGYGIERLISHIISEWGTKGDIYILGCTNVGKSSIFNALLKSDMCKSRAVNVVPKATVSPWPGTTLDLLCFPMKRITGYKLYMRTERLIAEREQEIADAKIKNENLLKTRNFKYATLAETVNRTFQRPFDTSDRLPIYSSDPFSISTNVTELEQERVFNPNHKDYIHGRWCYDSPGTVNAHQIHDLLTMDELYLAMPKYLIRPRVYSMLKGRTLFIGGIARIDYLESKGHCRDNILITVFASNWLPVTITSVENADEFYRNVVGHDVLAVPKAKNPKRLEQWPGLTPLESPIVIEGQGKRFCCTDIVLSSSGWVSIAAEEGVTCMLRAHTPEARGIFVRSPALLPRAHALRGKRIPNTPAFCRSVWFGLPKPL